MHECKEIIYPLLNETFDESYDSSIRIEFLNEEHEDVADANSKGKIISDTNFIVRDSNGTILGRFVYECQSKKDNTMLVRMYRYGARVAFEQKYEEDGILHIPFPAIAVLYLSGDGSEHIEESIVKVDFPDMTIDYHMKALRFKRYTIDELFEKKLYILPPFSLFLYDRELSKINDDRAKLLTLKEMCNEIISRLSEAQEKGNLTEYQKYIIFALMRSVADSLARKYDNVKKEVDDIMGGQLIEFDFTKGHKVGVKEGRIEERIDTLREFGMNEDKIAEDIKKKFNLTDDQAKKYLSGEGSLNDIKEA